MGAAGGSRPGWATEIEGFCTDVDSSGVRAPTVETRGADGTVN